VLNVPNLDDQRFDDILESSIRKIPYLYPEWTDYNVHDPGITMLELFAWYKQMQQYHLNQIPERNQEAFLKLLGIHRRPQRPFSLVMRLLNPPKSALPKGTPILSGAGVPFELTQSVCPGGVRVKAVYSGREDGVYDVTKMLGHSQAPFPVFGQHLNGPHHELYIGLSADEPLSLISLWMDVSDPFPVKRNPFAHSSPNPRDIAIEAVGAGGKPVALETILDETHALSQSGRLVVRAQAPLPKTDCGMDLPSLCWLKLYLTDPGCEEMPSLCHILAGYAGARQTHTLCEHHDFTMPEPGVTELSLSTYLALTGVCQAYVRDERGWFALPCLSEIAAGEPELQCRLVVELPETIALDGEANLRIVCCEPDFAPLTTRASNGLPAQRLWLVQEDGAPLYAQMLLMCAVQGEPDRLQCWHYTTALHKAGPRDLLFTIDDQTGEICFGDNICGAIPAPGKQAVVIAGLAYTQGPEGSVTTGSELSFAGQDAPLGEVILSEPGCDLESIAQMRARLRRMLEKPAKAVTAQDCAAIAMDTPGIRIPYAKAVPLMNPENPSQPFKAHVSVVVLPYNTTRFPKPDARFLAAVQAQLDSRRTICTQMHAVGPEYIGVTVWAELISAESENKVRVQVEAALQHYFTPETYGERLGAMVLESELSSVVGSCPDVLGLVRLEARSGNANCPKTPQGELLVPPYAIAYLAALELHITHV